MSQDISRISLSGAQQIAPAKKSDYQFFPQQEKPSAADSRPLKVLTADTVLIDADKVVQGERLQRIEGSVTDKEKIATSIRQTDSALDAVSSRVQAMKASLAKIVKNYPPFSIDSKERMDYLRSFTTLRKEIDSMTIPPPPPRTSVEMKSEIWQEKGLTGLLPGELSSNASDAQVRRAHDQLGSAVQVISQGKQELRQNVMSLG